MSNIARLFGGAVFFVVLLLGAGSLPAQASSLTSSQIQSILSLLSSFGADSSTINSVNNALGDTSTTSGGGTVFCHNFNSDITFGSSWSDVSPLLTVLSKEFSQAEFPGDEVTTKSFFNENVAATVVMFQAKYGIRQTGYVGPITRAKLNVLYGCSNQTTVPTPTAINGSCSATHYSCSAGASVNPVSNPSSYTWTCAGYYGGTDASCSEVKSVPVTTYTPAASIAGVCGNANGKVYAYGSPNYSPDTPQCASGSSTNTQFPAAGSSTTWYCNSTTGGSSSPICSASQSVITIPTQTPAPASTSGIPNVSSISTSSTSAGNAYNTSVSGGSTVYAYGTNFAQGVYIAVDGPNGSTIPSSSIRIISSTVLSFVVPSLNLGSHSITVIRSSADFGKTGLVWLTVSSPTSQPAVAAVAGVCGSAMKTYAYTSSSYSFDEQCSKGSASNTSFPSAGSSVSWTCSGANGGAASQTCTAVRSAAPVTIAPVYTPPASTSGIPNVSSISTSSTSAGNAYNTSVSGGSTVYAYGTNFAQGVYIAVDGPNGSTIPSSSIRIISSTVLSFVVPSLNLGSHSITIIRSSADFGKTGLVWLTVSSPTS